MQLQDWTALGTAIRTREGAGVAELIAQGADPNERFLDKKRGGKGFWPIEYAVCIDDGPCVAALVAGGADLNVEFDVGGTRFTPLSLAQVMMCGGGLFVL
jgi:hypothetical protein